MYSGTDNSNRFEIANILKTRVEKEIHLWLENHIEDFFFETIISILGETFEAIYGTLHEIQDEMLGINTRNSTNLTLAAIIGSCSTSIYGTFLLSRFVGLPVAATIFVVGITSGIMFSDDFVTVRNKSFDAVIQQITMELIKTELHRNLEKKMKCAITTFLEDTLLGMITNSKKSIETMLKKLEEYRREEDNLRSLGSQISNFFDKLDVVESLKIEKKPFSMETKA